MNPNRYNFNDVFDTSQLQSGIIILRYHIIINGAPFNRGVAISRYTSFGGLNLFNYIGRDIAGTFNPIGNILTILGFY